ncbi:MAG: hypothetical protein PHN47_08420, partial [Clostridia bacterium]|nr:hypothetical protein [Clostridia bacterium]
STFWGFEDDLQHIIEWVLRIPLMTGDETLTAVNGIILDVYAIMVPMGLTLMSFIFLIGFFNKTMMFEFTNWENILKWLFRFIVAKVIMENCLFFLTICIQILVSIVGGLSLLGDLGGETQQIIDFNEVIREMESKNFISQIFYAMEFLVVWVIMILIKMGIYGILIGRFVEIAVYTFIAPLPIATMVSDEFSSIAFRFFQSYMAVLLQGLVIILICFTYLAIAREWILTSGIVDNFFGMIRYLLSLVAFFFMLLKSEGWAKALVGL